MALLTAQFNAAKSNVEPSDEDKADAPRRHEEVRDALDESEQLDGLGLHAVLIGSYRRQVSIRRVKDVDVFCKLEELLGAEPDLGAKALLDRFEKALHETIGEDRVSRQKRSFQVSFPSTELFVDVVPARPCGDHWEIPNRAGGWEETNPEQLKTLTEKMNDKHADRYVPVVKLVRQTRRVHLGDQPGGLYFEVLTYHAFDSGAVAGTNTAECFTSALEQVVVQLDSAIASGLADPTLPGQTIDTRATETQLDAARNAFRDLAVKSRDALEEEDRCRAARLWREIFGQNENGWVFPLPDDCDEEDGRSAGPTLITAGQPHVPEGDGRFA